MADPQPACAVSEPHTDWFTMACPVVRRLARYYELRDRYIALGTTRAADACGEALVIMECEIAGMRARSVAGMMMQARIAQRIADDLDHDTARNLLKAFAYYAERAAVAGRMI